MHRDADPTTELPQHFAALRRLARDLVGPDDADDVVQEVAVQALSKPPRRPGPLGGWLAAVLRHVASHHRRASGRRTRHEAAAAGQRDSAATGATNGPDVEMLQALTAALAALPEPYRTAIWARYLQERTPAAIAAASGEPVATVKTRCKRGLQLLRQRLAATTQARDWRRALFGAFALEPSATASAGAASVAQLSKAATAGTGGLMATAATWWIGGVVGFAIVGSLLWWPEPADLPGAEAAAAGSAAIVDTTAAADLGIHDRAPRDAERTAVPVPGAVPAIATIVGRCVADTGAPLHGVPLRLSGQLRLGVDTAADDARVASYHGWLAAHPGATWQNLSTTAGDDGTFQLQAAAAPVAAHLLLVHDGIDHEVELPPLVAGASIDLGDLQLARACQVAVRAIDANGAAVPTAPIRLLREAQALPAERLRQPRELLASTADGTIATVIAGTWRVDVLGHDVVRGGQCVVPQQVSTFAHTVVVAPPTSPDTIQGTVVDGHDQPLADVEVLAIPGNSFARTAPDGRFVLPLQPPAGAHVQLSVRRKGWSLTQGRLRAQWGDHELRFVMEPTTSLRLRVVDDRTGAALPDVTVWRWLDPDHPPLGDVATRGTQRTEGANASGEVLLHDVPRGHHLLVVEPNGTTHARSEAVPVAVAPPNESTLEVRLQTAAERTLHVHTAGGDPVADAGVELLVGDAPSAPVSASTATTTLAGWDPLHLPFANVLLQRGRTDAAGTFVLRGPGTRPVAVRVSPPGRPPFVVGPVTLPDPQPLHAVVPGGVAVRLAVGPEAFTRAIANPPEAPGFGGPPPAPGFRLRRGAGQNAVSVPAASEPPIPLAADGTLSLADVPPGPWSLELQWVERSDGGATFAQAMRAVVAAVVVPAHGETVVPVDLGGWLPVAMHATVLRAGRPLANAMLSLTVTRPDLTGTGTLRMTMPVLTDGEGRFRFRGRPGTARIRAELPGPSGGVGEQHSGEEVWLPGERREVTFVFE